MTNKAKQTAQTLAKNALSVCQALLPGGYKAGNYWLCGDISGSEGQSLYVHLSGNRAGFWSDNATGEHGDLLELIKIQQSCTIGEAIKYAGNFANLPQANSLPKSNKPQKAKDLTKLALKIWEASTHISNTLAAKYLVKRGLSSKVVNNSVNLRFHARCKVLRSHGKADYKPALIAAVRDNKGALIAIHRTFLDAPGVKADMKSPKRALATTRNGAVYFCSSKNADCLVIAEGIETALSLKTCFPAANLAAVLSAGNMQNFAPPAKYSRIVIAADAGKAGHAAAHALKAKLQSEGLKVCIITPTGDDDFNTDLQTIGKDTLKAHITHSLKGYIK